MVQLIAHVSALNPRYSIENILSLSLHHTPHKSLLTMSLFTHITMTNDLPQTYTILQRFLPSVLKSTCFNDECLPFSEEVKKTEIGHLFEHILLEYLCELKIKKGSKLAVYNGVTNWNWHKYPKGTFHISIDSGIKDADIFPQALSQSMCLLEMIMNTNEVRPLSLPDKSTVN